MEELPVKLKSVPVEHFNTEAVVNVSKKRRAPTSICTDTEPVENNAAKVRNKRKRKRSKALDVVEVSSSDNEESFKEELPKVTPVRRPVVATENPTATKQEEEKINLLQSKLLALQKENELLKQTETVPPPPTEAIVPIEPPGNSLILLQDRHTTTSSVTHAPNHAFLAETCKKLYLDNIGLRTEVDIFDLEAREQFRARKRAEGRLAQVEASTIFESIMLMNKSL